MVGHRRDGRSGGPNDVLVGDPLVQLVDDLPHGQEVAKLDVEGSDPVRRDCDAVGDVPDAASTASATIFFWPPRLLAGAAVSWSRTWSCGLLRGCGLRGFGRCHAGRRPRGLGNDVNETDFIYF